MDEKELIVKIAIIAVIVLIIGTVVSISLSYRAIQKRDQIFRENWEEFNENRKNIEYESEKN